MFQILARGISDQGLPGQRWFGCHGTAFAPHDRAQRNGDVPTPDPVDEYITAYYDDSGGFGPKLDITYTAATPPVGDAQQLLGYGLY